jgi:hypothetical protein
MASWGLIGLYYDVGVLNVSTENGSGRNRVAYFLFTKGSHHGISVIIVS